MHTGEREQGQLTHQGSTHPVSSPATGTQRVLEFEVTGAANGLDASKPSSRPGAQLVRMGLDLPDVDGLEVCRRLRTFSDAYIMMLTGRADEVDRFARLDGGADDYLIKPFSFKELKARIRAMFRRLGTTSIAASDELTRAAAVQQSLLPQEPVLLEDYDIAGSFQPSGSVGGDFYDWYQTPTDCISRSLTP